MHLIMRSPTYYLSKENVKISVSKNGIRISSNFNNVWKMFKDIKTPDWDKNYVFLCTVSAWLSGFGNKGRSELSKTHVIF